MLPVPTVRLTSATIQEQVWICTIHEIIHRLAHAPANPLPCKRLLIPPLLTTHRLFGSVRKAQAPSELILLCNASFGMPMRKIGLEPTFNALGCISIFLRLFSHSKSQPWTYLCNPDFLCYFRHYPYTVPFYTPLQILCGTRRNRDSASLMSLYTAVG